jgi:hypothetical protein
MSNGGPSRAIPIHSAAISEEPLSPNAIGSDGRIAVSVAPPDSWFYEPGVLDPSTGVVTRIRVPQTADYFVVGWGAKGQIGGSFRSRASGEG